MHNGWGMPPPGQEHCGDPLGEVRSGHLLMNLVSAPGRHVGRGVGNLCGHEAQISASRKQCILGLINVCSR